MGHREPRDWEEEGQEAEQTSEEGAEWPSSPKYPRALSYAFITLYFRVLFQCLG